MAKIGNLLLVDGNQFHSGGSYRIKGIPESNHLVSLDNWEVEIQSGNPFAVARTKSDIPEDKIVQRSYERLQRGLDILSVENEGDYHCKELKSERIVAWREGGKQFVQLVGIADLSMSTSVTATAYDEDGNAIENEIPETEWHESLRFFRLSQSTDDLFDAYRNAFLALETLLSDRTPKRGDEGESDWLKRSLRSAHEDIGLENFAPNQSSPVESIHGYQYEHTRCEMFHAKKAEASLLPHRVDDREHVETALKDLLRMYVRILEDTVEVNRSSGIVTNIGFEQMSEWLLDDHCIEVALANNESHLNASDTLHLKDWDESGRMEASFSEENSQPGMTATFAEGRVQDGKFSSPIYHIGLVKKEESSENLILTTQIESGLVLDSLDAFQVIHGLRLDNSNAVKSQFIS